MDFNSYNLALQEAFDERQEQQDEFNQKKMLEYATNEATTAFDMPVAEKLIEHSLKSESAKKLFAKAISKASGISPENAEGIVGEIQENGLKGLFDSRIKDALKDRVMNNIEGEGEEGIIGKLTNIFTTGKEKLVNLLKTHSPATLSELKQKVFDEGKERYNNLLAEKKSKIEEFNSRGKELEERFNKLPEGSEERDALISQVKELKSQKDALKADYNDRLSSLKQETQDRIKDIQDGITGKAEELASGFKDSVQEITSAGKNAIGNIGDSIPVPTDLIESIKSPVATFRHGIQEGGDDLISNAKEALSNSFFSKVKGFLSNKKSLAERAIDFHQNMEEGIKDITGDNELDGRIKDLEDTVSRLQRKYETATSDSKIAKYRKNISDASNALEELKNAREDMITERTNELRDALMEEHGLTPETLKQGISERYGFGTADDLVNDIDVVNPLSAIEPLTENAGNAIETVAGAVDNLADIGLGVGTSFIKNAKTRGILQNTLQLLQSSDTVHSQVTGSDSTIARAIKASAKKFTNSESNKLLETPEKPVSPSEGMQQRGESIMEAVERMKQETTTPQPTTQHQTEETPQPETQATNDIVPQSEEEMVDVGESVAEKTGKEALEAGAKNVVKEAVGETAGELAGEEGLELGLGDVIPGLGLLIGLGTMIGQTVHNIHEAKQQANIHSINPAVNFGV